jgi:hypothetical protein
MIPAESDIHLTLEPLGFAKRGRTWRRTIGDVVQVINLQRGFGGQIHINLGVYYMSLGIEKLPSEHQCHVRARLERIAEPRYFTAIRSLDNSCKPSDEALAALHKCGVSWLQEISTPHGLCDFLASGWSSGFVHRSAREMCNEHTDA